MGDQHTHSGSWNPRLLTLVGITLAAAGSRLLPHPPNFTPIGVIALFGGAYFSSKWAAFGIPLFAMMISNFLLAVFYYGGSLFPFLPYVYASFLLTVCFGFFLRRRRSPWVIGSFALLSALLFFLISNFGVWLPGKMYPRTAEGLVACYVAAIPFLRNMMWGNLVYATVLFGGFELAEHYVPALRERRIVVTPGITGAMHG